MGTWALFFAKSVCVLSSLSAAIIVRAAPEAHIPPPGPDGKYTLEAEGICAKFIPYSAAITNLFLPDRNGTLRDVVVGHDNASDYPTDPFHLNWGAVPGRYANRIVNATYELDGVQYTTQRNSGNSTIHSGTNGWSYRTWNVTAVSRSSITFTVRDESNSSLGLPGLVLGSVTYTLTPHAWHIKLRAEPVTHVTPLMLTNHAYWNLDAFANPHDVTVLNHTFSMPYSRRLITYDVNAEPTGEIKTLAPGDINDFWSAPKHIGANESSPEWTGNCGEAAQCQGYDTPWTVDRTPAQLDKPIASLSSAWSGIKWDLYSNQEGIVVFSCPYLVDGLVRLKSTQLGGPASDGFLQLYGCIAVEAQDWVAGINFPQWGREKHQIFRPGQVYENDIVYRFSII